MKIYLVDTNIFLEIMLSQTRSGDCKTLLNMIKNGDIKAIVTDFSIYSIMLIMSNYLKIKELKVFLSSLSAYKGLTIYRSKLTDILMAVEIMEKKGLDVDDAMQYSAAFSSGAKAIISFDKHFDNLEIPGVEPARLI
ncbi:MAG: PIN domain-containing protein [Thermoproteota archaeon]